MADWPEAALGTPELVGYRYRFRSGAVARTFKFSTVVTRYSTARMPREFDLTMKLSDAGMDRLRGFREVDLEGGTLDFMMSLRTPFGMQDLLVRMVGELVAAPLGAGWQQCQFTVETR